jgi:hypothetical protein
MSSVLSTPASTSALDTLCINTARFLSVDAVQKAPTVDSAQSYAVAARASVILLARPSKA